jgi:carbonic anhydrase
MNAESHKSLPCVSTWFHNAEATRRIVQQRIREQPDLRPQEIAPKANVLVQLSNLRTHPSVAAATALGTLELHGWFYRIETGEILIHSAAHDRFLSLHEMHELERRPVELNSAAV